MDSLTLHYPATPVAMPERAPLRMPEQNLSVLPALRDADVVGQGPDRRAWILRAAVLAPTTVLTAIFVIAQANGLARGGFSWVEKLHLWLAGFAFFFIAFSLAGAALGLFSHLRGKLLRREVLATIPTDMNVALLIPIHNEDSADVFGNAAALLEDLSSRDEARHFSLFILSDTRSDGIAAEEWRAFQTLRMEQGHRFAIHYRRRDKNTDRKTGNIADWVTGWGAAYEAMLVLDADSLMSADAVITLRRELAANPGTGLVQTWPRLIRSDVLFARVQQFATAAHGRLMALGLATWARGEANYWGHNAIIRTRAFAAAAGLPHLKGIFGGRTLIMSHDFVEAAMLRRAGWRVRFLPQVDGSYEQTPASLVDYVLRDRRWCRGNLQHLRVIPAVGLHAVSRFHMLQGAVSYLMAVLWLVLLSIWAFPEMATVAMGIEGAPPIVEPVDGFVSGGNLFLICVLAMLLGPKLLGMLSIMASRPRAASFGGRARFMLAVLIEIVVSFLYAPILMIQQVQSILFAVLSKRDIWAPQSRSGAKQSWGSLLRFHIIETVLGLACLGGIAAGEVTFWLLPVGLSLAGAVPLSALSAWDVSRLRTGAWMETPDSLNPPQIVNRATLARARYRLMLDTDPAFSLAAE